MRPRARGTPLPLVGRGWGYSPPPCGEGLGVLPSPLWGGAGGGGREIGAPPFAMRTTPLPNPPPQGGREQTEFATRADSISHERALAPRLPAEILRGRFGARSRPRLAARGYFFTTTISGL